MTRHDKMSRRWGGGGRAEEGGDMEDQRKVGGWGEDYNTEALYLRPALFTYATEGLQTYNGASSKGA